MDKQRDREARVQAELDRRVAGLARDVEPGRDLWPAIESSLEKSALDEPAPGGADPGEQRGAPASRYGWWGAAAAALAVAAILPLLLRESPGPVDGVPEDGVPMATVPAETIPVQPPAGATDFGIDTAGQRLRLRNAAVTSVQPGPEYEEARAELLALLEERLEGLAPEEREIVVRNIEAIRGALEEIDTALQDNPDDPLLQELMLKTYQTELDVMARVNGLAGPAKRRTDL